MPASFAPLRQVDAGLLNVGYVDLGPADGTVVVLLHGWPYDIHGYAAAAPLLVAAGYRVIVPYLRGYGTTTIRSSTAFRNGQQAIMAVDLVALMDALHIDEAILAGFDWGGRAADCVAALWPKRCKALVSVGGDLIIDVAANEAPLPPKAELGWWYQYYFATPRGVRGYTEYRHDFAKLIWKLASPTWTFDEATYDQSAPAFDNADHVAIVIHNYRWRQGLADGEAQYADLERRLGQHPVITVPTITIGSDFDGANIGGAAYRKQFSGAYEHRTLHGIGHNVPQEAPQPFVQAILDVDRFA
jgi:pimeloyl-ACP methyl ester carboxylesterase